MKEISRRQFLQGLAAGAAGIGVSAVFPAMVPEAEAERAEVPEKPPVSASEMTLTVLGARGSAPICRRDSMIFGGLTSCYMFRACGETLFLDAGTGLQYAPEEHESKKGFGHSTAEMGLELLERSGAGKLLLIHHDPTRTDRELLEMEKLIGRENVRYAREGEVIVL